VFDDGVRKQQINRCSLNRPGIAFNWTKLVDKRVLVPRFINVDSNDLLAIALEDAASLPRVSFQSVYGRTATAANI
jgi:hypothetical protein